tara:strand:+ start:74 stop:415 length:342 start_codon:yes stop_codon:yes gene_type:complete
MPRYFKVNIKPLSVNEAFRGKKFKTKKYIKFEEEMLWRLPKMDIPEGKLEIHYKIGFSNSNSDLDNAFKQLNDCLQKKYSFNDNLIYKIFAEKEIVKKGQEFIQFKICQLDQK